MAAQNWVPFFHSDWRSGCLVLNLEEEGLYIRSCNFTWDTGEPLPCDDRQAARLLGVQVLKYIKVMSSLIEKGKMQRSNVGVFNARVLRTVEDMKRQQDERSQRASRGHQNRKSSWETIQELTAAVMDLRRQLDEAKAVPQGVQGGYTPHHTPPLSLGVTGGATAIVPQGVTPLVDAEKAEQNQQNADALQNEPACNRSRIPDTRYQSKKEEEVKGNAPVGASPPDEPVLVDIAPTKGPGRAQALAALNAYNDLAARCALPQAAKLTPARERAIIARLREYGLDGWQQALAMIERSAFLRGRNERNWRADLDFLAQASSFSKVIDGRYGNGAHAGVPTEEQRRVEEQSRRDFELAAAVDIGGDRC